MFTASLLVFASLAMGASAQCGLAVPCGSLTCINGNIRFVANMPGYCTCCSFLNAAADAAGADTHSWTTYMWAGLIGLIAGTVVTTVVVIVRKRQREETKGYTSLLG